MFYKWLIEIVHLTTGEIRRLDMQDSLEKIAKWEKEINKSGWDIRFMKKMYT